MVVYVAWRRGTALQSDVDLDIAEISVTPAGCSVTSEISENPFLKICPFFLKICCPQPLESTLSTTPQALCEGSRD